MQAADDVEFQRAFARTLFRAPGYFTCFLSGIAALWAGGEMIMTLLYGFVLIPLPAFTARLVTVLCLGTGASLLPLVFRLADHSDPDPVQERPTDALASDPGLRADRGPERWRGERSDSLRY